MDCARSQVNNVWLAVVTGLLLPQPFSSAMSRRFLVQHLQPVFPLHHFEEDAEWHDECDILFVSQTQVIVSMHPRKSWKMRLFLPSSQKRYSVVMEISRKRRS